MSFTVVNDGMALRPVRSGTSPLRARILSALVMLPAAVAAVMAGSPYFEVMAILAALVMAWEWARICNEGRLGLHGYLHLAIMALALAAAALKSFDLSLVIVVTGSAAVFYAARVASDDRAAWAAAGVLAVGLPVVALIWIEGASGAGWQTVMWLFGAVWATDIGAYGFGRWIGGARMAPRISPGKTWAGLAGGAACAAAWSVLWGWHLAAPSLLWLGIAGILVAIFAQAGDLAVSVVKRRFGVKDTSGLIPGHGGVLDRVDGLMGSAPVLAVSLFAVEGGRASWLGL